MTKMALVEEEDPEDFDKKKRRRWRRIYNELKGSDTAPEVAAARRRA